MGAAKEEERRAVGSKQEERGAGTGGKSSMQ